jgi:hypothetical protein
MLAKLLKGAALMAALSLFGLFVFQMGVSYEHQKNKHPPRENRSEQPEAKQPESKETPTVHIECEPNCAAKSSDDQSGEHAIYWRINKLLQKTIDDPVAAFTGLLFIATCFLAWLAVSQSRDTHILQRAYIRAVPKGISNMTTGEIVGHVSFENVGKLPASNFRWIVKPLTLESGTWEPPKLTDGDLLAYSSVVNIAGIFRRGTAPIGPGNTVSGKYWFVWGRVKYLDGFGKERFVSFCHSYPVARSEIPSGGGYEIKDEYARYHDYGNDAD